MTTQPDAVGTAQPAEPADQPAVTLHHQADGPTLGTTTAPVVEVEGRLFKDLARTGELLPYEDWRLSAQERAADLASRLSIEQIAGLMLYSPHQMVPNHGNGPFRGTYDGGRTYAQAGVPAWSLTDQQRTMLTQDHVRHVLAITLQDADTAAWWNNTMQALAESTGLGVPVSTSTDPRNGAAEATGAEFATSAVDVSRWPEGLGTAALFDAERVREYASVISRECRALGISTALGPQIDISTEPRWMRLQDTWGPHSGLVRDYTRAYCDGMQTTEDSETPGAAFGLPAAEPSATDTGWGSASVATMVKHWPGGGSGEAGRDARYGFGKFAVYPGHNEADHLRSFVEAAFDLDGPIGAASAVMPYYTVSWGYETPDGQVLNTGQADDPSGPAPTANAYNRVIVHDMLRERLGYDGVVCTDWGVTADPDPEMSSFGQRCYGVEELSATPWPSTTVSTSSAATARQPPSSRPSASWLSATARRLTEPASRPQPPACCAPSSGSACSRTPTLTPQPPRTRLAARTSPRQPKRPSGTAWCSSRTRALTTPHPSLCPPLLPRSGCHSAVSRRP